MEIRVKQSAMELQTTKKARVAREHGRSVYRMSCILFLMGDYFPMRFEYFATNFGTSAPVYVADSNFFRSLLG